MKGVRALMRSMKLVRKAKPRGKRLEFSKALVVWALTFTSGCTALSYILAFLDHDACSDITVAVITTCIAIAVAYEAKSFGEKNSRNKYGVNPCDLTQQDNNAENEDDSAALG